MSLPAIQWKCIREAFVLIERQWTERRRAKRLAHGIPWGDWLQVWNRSTEGLTNGEGENRLVCCTSLSRQMKRSRMGWKVGAGARKVRLLLWIAQVECRLPSAPPIWINRLCSANVHKATSFMLIALSAGFTKTGNVISAHAWGRALPPGFRTCHEDELSWLLIYSQK